MTASTPLVARISSLLNLLDEKPQAAPAAEAEPAVAISGEASARLAQFESVTGTIVKLVTGLKERMALLQAAGQEVRIFPPPPAVVHPKLVPQVPLYADLLRKNQDAAKLVGSAVLRYQEAAVDAEKMQSALGQGDLESINVEHVKGKYLFLCKIQLYFKDFPLLQQLFKPAKPPAPPTPTVEQPPAMRPFGQMAPMGAPKPMHRAPNQLGWYTKQSEATAVVRKHNPPARAATAPLNAQAQAQKLLQGLELKLLILQAACDPLQAVQRKSAALLPPPAQATAQTLAQALGADADTRARCQALVKTYQQARQLMAQKPVSNPALLKSLLSQLAAAPQAFRGHPLLEPLFAGR